MIQTVYAKLQLALVGVAVFLLAALALMFIIESWRHRRRTTKGEDQ